MKRDIKELLGKTLKDVKVKRDEDIIEFFLEDDEIVVMYHDQDCCEEVFISDASGDIKDLVGSEILMAEEITENRGECETWTFYKFATIKGYVTFRWIGRSNGYYSEKVDIKRVFLKLFNQKLVNIEVDIKNSSVYLFTKNKKYKFSCGHDSFIDFSKYEKRYFDRGLSSSVNKKIRHAESVESLSSESISDCYSDIFPLLTLLCIQNMIIRFHSKDSLKLEEFE